MDIASIILNAAKAVKVSGTLLLAICNHESNGFTLNYTPHDKGSPSFGSCQIKESTAKMLGFKGNVKKLNDPKINAKYAALYLQYQERRYGKDNWIAITSSYNAGSYVLSKKNPKCPKNIKYVNLVRTKLPEFLKNKLECQLNK